MFKVVMNFPTIEELKTNLEGIYDEIPSNFQFSADNGHSTDEKYNFS